METKVKTELLEVVKKVEEFRGCLERCEDELRMGQWGDESRTSWVDKCIEQVEYLTKDYNKIFGDGKGGD